MNNSDKSTNLVDTLGFPLTSTDIMANHLIILSTEEQLSDTFDILNLATFDWLDGRITSKDYWDYCTEYVNPDIHLQQMQFALQCLI